MTVCCRSGIQASEIRERAGQPFFGRFLARPWTSGAGRVSGVGRGLTAGTAATAVGIFRWRGRGAWALTPRAGSFLVRGVVIVTAPQQRPATLPPRFIPGLAFAGAAFVTVGAFDLN